GGGDPPQRHAVHAVELAVVASDPEGTARRPVEGEEVATVGAEHGTKSLRATAEQEAIVSRDPDLSGPGPGGAEMGLHAHVDPLPARVGAMQDQAVAADGPGAAPEVFDRLLLPRLDAQAVSIPERQSRALAADPHALGRRPERQRGEPRGRGQAQPVPTVPMEEDVLLGLGVVAESEDVVGAAARDGKDGRAGAQVEGRVAEAVVAQHAARLRTDPDRIGRAPPDAAQAELGSGGHRDPRAVAPREDRASRSDRPDLLPAAPQGVKRAEADDRYALPDTVHVATDLRAGHPQRRSGVPNGVGDEGEGLALQLRPAIPFQPKDALALHHPDAAGAGVQGADPWIRIGKALRVDGPRRAIEAQRGGARSRDPDAAGGVHRAELDVERAGQRVLPAA